MKNHWIQRRKSKQFRFTFGVIAGFPSCSVEVRPDNFGGIRIRTTDALFGKWTAGLGIGITLNDAVLAVYQGADLIESWLMYNIEILRNSTIFNGPGLLVHEISITCSNKAHINSKHFKII